MTACIHAECEAEDGRIYECTYAKSETATPPRVTVSVDSLIAARRSVVHDHDN